MTYNFYLEITNLLGLTTKSQAFTVQFNGHVSPTFIVQDCPETNYIRGNPGGDSLTLYYSVDYDPVRLSQCMPAADVINYLNNYANAIAIEQTSVITLYMITSYESETESYNIRSGCGEYQNGVVTLNSNSTCVFPNPYALRLIQLEATVDIVEIDNVGESITSATATCSFEMMKDNLQVVITGGNQILSRYIQ